MPTATPAMMVTAPGRYGHRRRLGGPTAVGLAVLACLVMACSGCAQRRPIAGDAEPSGNAPVNPRPTPPQTAGPRSSADPEALAASLNGFAREVRSRLGQPSFVVAVLPVTGPGGSTTGCSHHLADKLMAAFLSVSATVADRQTHQDIIREINLANTYDAPPASLRSSAADVIVVGRYTLAAGRLHLDLKAVEVRTEGLLHVASLLVRPGALLRQLAFAAPASDHSPDALSVSEQDGVVRIRASYTQPGAEAFRLLDRVRQRIRRALTRYLRDARGQELTSEQAEDHFRRGTERDCQFGQHSVTLEMEFGVDQ